MLRASGIECHVGKMYAGAFGIVDDVVLLSRSLDALKEMVSNIYLGRFIRKSAKDK